MSFIKTPIENTSRLELALREYNQDLSGLFRQFGALE
jgi:hypothetical protein